MKMNLSFLLLLFFSAQIMAQQSDSLEITPDSIHVFTFNPDTFEIVAHAGVVNKTSDSLKLRWERKVNDLTTGWSSAVCDINQCWANFVSTKDFDLAAGDTGLMDVHFYPSGNDGEGRVELLVYAVNDSSNINFTATYTAKANDTSTTLNPIHPDSGVEISLYPNPVSEWLNIRTNRNKNSSDQFKIELFDIKGKKVLQKNLNEQGKMNISSLPEGVYIIRVTNEAGVHVFSKEILKIK